MKKHESRKTSAEELDILREYYKLYNSFGDLIETCIGDVIYVDSNNFLHNLDGVAWFWGGGKRYYIHGRQYSKEEWLIKREELLLEIHREEMLNQI